MADENRHRHRLVARLILGVVSPGVTRMEQDARLVRSLDLQAMERDVALAGIGILADHQTGANEGTRILDARFMHRQMGEIELIKSTILRLCDSLLRFGYLQRMEDGRFRLGAAVFPLARIYQCAFNLRDVVGRTPRRRTDRTGETSSFYLSGSETRFTDDAVPAIRAAVVDEAIALTRSLGVDPAVFEPGDRRRRNFVASATCSYACASDRRRRPNCRDRSSPRLAVSIESNDE